MNYSMVNVDVMTVVGEQEFVSVDHDTGAHQSLAQAACRPVCGCLERCTGL